MYTIPKTDGQLLFGNCKDRFVGFWPNFDDTNSYHRTTDATASCICNETIQDGLKSLCFLRSKLDEWDSLKLTPHQILKFVEMNRDILKNNPDIIFLFCFRNDPTTYSTPPKPAKYEVIHVQWNKEKAGLCIGVYPIAESNREQTPLEENVWFLSKRFHIVTQD